MSYVVQFGFEFASRRRGLPLLDYENEIHDPMQHVRVIEQTHDGSLIGGRVEFDTEEAAWKLWRWIVDSDIVGRCRCGSIVFHECRDEWSCDEHTIQTEFIHGDS